MYFTHAITRLPADTVAAGLTTASLGAPDAALTRQQFREYIDILLQLGLTVTTLPALPDFPDAHFVEDVAVMMPELVIITHPGAAARRGEVHSIAPLVSRFRHAVWLGEGEHMDGGDVLMVDKRFSSACPAAPMKRASAALPARWKIRLQRAGGAGGLRPASEVGGELSGAIPCCCRRPRLMNRHSVIFATSCWTRPRNTPATPCGSTTP
jgi:hypothetical protein